MYASVLVDCIFAKDIFLDFVNEMREHTHRHSEEKKEMKKKLHGKSTLFV